MGFKGLFGDTGFVGSTGPNTCAGELAFAGLFGLLGLAGLLGFAGLVGLLGDIGSDGGNASSISCRANSVILTTRTASPDASSVYAVSISRKPEGSSDLMDKERILLFNSLMNSRKNSSEFLYFGFFCSLPPSCNSRWRMRDLESTALGMLLVLNIPCAVGVLEKFAPSCRLQYRCLAIPSLSYEKRGSLVGQALHFTVASKLVANTFNAPSNSA